MNKSHSRKPKVLNVGFHPPPPGGMAIFIENFENSEIRDFFDLRGFDTDYPRWLKRFRPLTVLYLPIMYLHYIWILAVFKPDVVHIHTPAFNSFYKHALFLKITRERDIPVALHIHAGKFKEFYDNLKKSKQRDVCGKLADANLLIVLSNYWKDFFADLYPVEKIRIVENGIPVHVYCPGEDLSPSNGKNFLYVGRVLQQKGMDELLDACLEVFRIYPDAHLTIAGGEDVAHYSSKAEKMNISKH
ncbi:glycosyltransferase family 4 protein, partial [bacterium]|nr:glycosyltransferase family 4 protein [bacterium]MBU1024435.1 glycosyltransferase family 4 protein [bacterium]